MRQNRPCLRRIGAHEREAPLAGVGHSPAEAKEGASGASASSGNYASDMSEQEEEEDALRVVVDPNKQWTTMEDRAGQSIERDWYSIAFLILRAVLR